MNSYLHFLGGAQTVTGSKFLLETDGKKILIDCGLFQGLKNLRLLNWAPFPIDPGEVDAVLITHAHLDHIGYLPILVKNGFRGPIYCSAPTADLAQIILLDSAKIHEEDADRANAGGYSKHTPAKPLYTVADAKVALRMIQTLSTNQPHKVFPGIEVQLRNSGHILGSTLIEIQTPSLKIVFTGDLGRGNPLLMRPPEEIIEADYIVTESTYGDRLHSPLSPLKDLSRITNETHQKGGTLIIPAFAVGRVQDLLYLFSILRESSQIPQIPIFVDTPMGINTTEIFIDYPEWHRLSKEEVQALSKSVTLVKSRVQSEEIKHHKSPSIVIAGSGMVSGGRVLSHLLYRLPDPRTTVLLVGFQAPSTGGNLLRSGVPELKIYGEYVPVRARIEEISSLSAHGDQRDILNWLSHLNSPPMETFIVHGEPQAANALRVKIQDELGWRASVPELGAKVRLKPRTD